MAGTSIADFMAHVDRIAALGRDAEGVTGPKMPAFNRVVAASRATREEVQAPTVGANAGMGDDLALDGSLLNPAQRRRLEGQGYEFNDVRRPAIPMGATPAPAPRSPLGNRREFTPGKTVAASRRDDRLDGSLLTPAELKKLRDRGIDVAGPGDR